VTTQARLVPAPAKARAQNRSRMAVAFGPAFLMLFGAGLLWLGPALFDSRYLFGMAAWDALLVAGWMADAVLLPSPESFGVRRSWSSPLSISVPSEVIVAVSNESSAAVDVVLTDAMPRPLRVDPPTVRVRVPSGGQEEARFTAIPTARGEIAVGDAYFRYRSVVGLAERWGRAGISQRVTVYPNLDEAARAAVQIVRGSRSELTHRRRRAVRGDGRSFESLREHRAGDDPRDICWTASARRGALVTRQFEAERSQAVWIVIDAGRLMRASVADGTKLDRAVTAALAVARTALAAGDRVGVLVYGRRIVQRLPASRGDLHLRRIVDALSAVQPEEAEADHTGAAGRLAADQRRRSLILWITDVPDAATTPEVVAAAAGLAPRHLVTFVAIGHAQLNEIAVRRPESAREMYETAAAQEIAHRRDVLLARLRARGIPVVETPSSLATALVASYLEVKRRGRL